MLSYGAVTLILWYVCRLNVVVVVLVVIKMKYNLSKERNSITSTYVE